jgi:hypothetical protein
LTRRRESSTPGSRGPSAPRQRLGFLGVSAIAQRPRKHTSHPDLPVRDRPVSSMQLVLDRARGAVMAWCEQDEAEVRSELRALAAEATLLARTHPLPLAGLHTRQRIALQKDRTKRGGC